MEYRIDFSGNLRVSITESGMRNSKRLCDNQHIYKQCKSTNKGAGILTVQHLRLVHDSSPFTDENNIERKLYYTACHYSQSRNGRSLEAIHDCLHRSANMGD